MPSHPRNQTKWRALKRIFALTQENATPINKSMCIQIFIAMLASSFSMTYTFAFLPEMIVSLGHREENKGYYVGVITSAYHIGRLSGCYFWGWLSDKKGPKTVLLINCVLMAAANVAFGLSVDVTMATVTRFLCGLPSGIVPVLKSVLCDISDSTNQAFYLSLISLGWSCGMIIGPLLAGYLSNPATKYGVLLEKNEFLIRFPYFLASLLPVALFMLSFLVIALKWDSRVSDKRKQAQLGEITVEMKSINQTDCSNPGEDCVKENSRLLYADDNAVSTNTRPDQVAQKTKSLPIINNSESHIRTSLININKHKCNTEGPTGSNFSSYAKDPLLQFSSSTPTLYKDNSVRDYKRDICKSVSLADVRTIQHQCCNRHHDACGPTDVSRETTTAQDEKNNANDVSKVTHTSASQSWLRRIFAWNICRLLRNRTFRATVTLYSLTSMCNIVFDALFAVWASTDIQLNGIGFQPEDIGRFISIAALPIVFLQIYLYPKLERSFGAKKVLHWFCQICIFVTTIMPATRILLPHPAAMWTCMVTLHAFYAFAEMAVFSSITLFINNSVPSSIVGSANGISMTVASLARFF